MYFPLYITYDDKKIRDGFGAQGLRIVGIFSIAKFFRIKYLHQGISEISDQIELVGVSGDKSRYLSALNKLNEIISFPSSSDTCKRNECVEVEVHNLGFKTLFRFMFLSLISPNRYLLKVCLPFGIVDRFPLVYMASRKYINRLRPTFTRNGSIARYVVHVRASEHSPDKSRPQLGPAYYEKLIFSDKYGSTLDATWIIHTDFYDLDFKMEVSSERVLRFQSLISKLQKTESIEVYNYAEIEKVFSDMVNADLLIISRSALSYLAGVLCKGTVIYPSNHGHVKLRGWIKELAE